MTSSRTEPLPFNPESPHVQVVRDSLAAVLRAAALGKLDARVDGVLPIPAPRALSWSGHDFACEGSTWRTESGALELEIRRATFRPDEKLRRMFRVMNQPAKFQLEGDDQLEARLAHLTGHRQHVDVANQRAVTTYTLMLDSWTWQPPSTVACGWDDCTAFHKSMMATLPFAPEAVCPAITCFSLADTTCASSSAGRIERAS